MSIEYREIEPPAALRRHLQCVWWLGDPTPDMSPQVIYPDGCCELIVHLGAPMTRRLANGIWERQACCLFAAQQTAAIVLRAGGAVACVGVRLRPAASAAVVDGRLVALRDQIVDLASLDATFAAQLQAAASASRGLAEPAALWELLARTLGQHPIDPGIESAVDVLAAEPGLARVASLASAIDLPLRTFQDRFLRAVGLPAKAYARLLRLHNAIRRLDSEAQGLAAVALDAGFSDQPHATRELRRLTGMTPARLLDALRGERQSETTIALAAAFVRGGRQA